MGHVKLHASHAGCTSNPKVCTPRFTHPAPFAPHGMACGHSACHPFAGYGNPTVIQIGHSCHSALTHAHDMRFAACHPCTCSCLTCLTCMRRFPAADSPRAGATRGARRAGNESGIAACPAPHHPCTMLHACTPPPCMRILLHLPHIARPARPAACPTGAPHVHRSLTLCAPPGPRIIFAVSRDAVEPGATAQAQVRTHFLTAVFIVSACLI